METSGKWATAPHGRYDFSVLKKGQGHWRRHKKTKGSAHTEWVIRKESKYTVKPYFPKRVSVKKFWQVETRKTQMKGRAQEAQKQLNRSVGKTCLIRKQGFKWTKEKLRLLGDKHFSLQRKCNKLRITLGGKILKNLKIFLGVGLYVSSTLWVSGDVSDCFWFSAELICFSEWEVKSEFLQCRPG